MPSGAVSTPSGAALPPTWVARKPRAANASQAATSKAVGSSPVAVVRKRSLMFAMLSGVNQRGNAGSVMAGHASVGSLSRNCDVPSI